MQTLEKSLKKDKYPSFSSTLLDEIYRSIDKKEGECNGVRQKINTPIEEDEEMGSLNRSRRACLIDKWMEKKVNGKNLPFLSSDFEKDSVFQDNDPLYFSSSSISSDSSSGGFSSSDTEFFSASASATTMTKTRTRTSCFATSWKQPKPIKTKIQENQAEKDTTLIKSRSRAVKIYTNLKNLKQQPISPGGRLTSFINSLFTTNGTSSKTGVNEVKEGAKVERKCKSNQTSACSSATSFSRSCLTKSTPSTTSRSSSSSKIHQNNNAQRTVSFTVDEMRSRRTQCSEEMNKFREEMDGLKAYKKDDFVVVEKRSDFVEEDGDDDDDAASDCSSDLFEIDHLVLFGGNKRFCDELPVYETTHLDKNLAITSGLVR